jgi:hypothetical protein
VARDEVDEVDEVDAVQAGRDRRQMGRSECMHG